MAAMALPPLLVRALAGGPGLVVVTDTVAVATDGGPLLLAAALQLSHRLVWVAAHQTAHHYAALARKLVRKPPLPHGVRRAPRSHTRV
jgi:hypothetical protein